MANVFTKKSHTPRTTTQRDFGGLDPITLPKILSQTRHVDIESMVGRNHNIKVSCSIWNPVRRKAILAMPIQFQHLRWVNFSCGPVVISPKQRGKPPDIKYTENSISRSSYCDPTRYTNLQANMHTTRYGYTPQTKPARGVVPNVKPPEYRPVE